MQFDDLQLSEPEIEAAIDYNPLKVTSDTQLIDVIALMNERRIHSCSLSSVNSHSDGFPIHETGSSCVLVVQERELLGIFTERDIVRLTAASIPFEKVTIAEVMTKPVITLSQTTFKDIFAPLFLFRRYRIRHLPILGQKGELIGVVSHESIRSILRPIHLLKLMRVGDVMTTQVIRAPVTASVLSLAQVMAEYKISCVVITEQYPELELGHFIHVPVGIVTERDIVQFQALQMNLTEVRAQSVMSTPLFLLSPEDSLLTALREMHRRHTKRLVVSWDGGKELGLVTQSSLLRVLDPVQMYGVIATLQKTVI
ncbi:CBS domain-containing protein [Scytonema sp. UIC 10036]|uniref:CBS domain-containing protein n=1 Tax=Scytonema sp. UIC 10036 TaxID=2304196 RepID=UPI0012DA36EF|nr:CBS domain-containing protein [Scytonema sp. UIC 10036]MUG96568.1 CBS domain-containing protein [Scytonema sp. UIC 10036]